MCRCEIGLKGREWNDATGWYGDGREVCAIMGVVSADRDGERQVRRTPGFGDRGKDRKRELADPPTVV